MKWILARLREPSTWAGIAGILLAATKFPVSAEMGQTIAALAGMAGAVAAALAEKTRPSGDSGGEQ